MKPQKLTAREREILEMAAFGQSAKEIAYELDIRTDTVETHIKNIKEKTHLQKAGELSSVWLIYHYHIPVLDVPERFRKAIAIAFTALSLFTIVFQTTDMLRVFRGNGQVQDKTVNTRCGAARARKSDYQFSN